MRCSVFHLAQHTVLQLLSWSQGFCQDMRVCFFCLNGLSFFWHGLQSCCIPAERLMAMVNQAGDFLHSKRQTFHSNDSFPDQGAALMHLLGLASHSVALMCPAYEVHADTSIFSCISQPNHFTHSLIHQRPSFGSTSNIA